MKRGRDCVIIGAGPAGLTAAHELLERTDVRPVVCEETADVGGLSRTVNYRGNRIDIGGHRFFSRSDRVMAWWRRILPVEGGPDPETTDRVMLVRRRRSRILYRGRYFDYPVTFGTATLSGLGFCLVARIGASYLRARLFPIRQEKSLEDFFVNRFGRALYATFFRDYTEKVWGVPCDRIRPEWGAQRVKGLSIPKALSHAAMERFPGVRRVLGGRTETSLIGQFLYPKFGPGQLWEEVARIVEERGGEIRRNHRVVGLRREGNRISGISAEDRTTGARSETGADFVISSMPVRELVGLLTPPAPEDVRRAAEGLAYRDFITVGLLFRRPESGILPDNWIYVQDRSVRLGRVQIFNNWSPWLVGDPGTVWLGLEYFCNEGDDLWNRTDGELLGLAGEELERIGIARRADVLDGVAIRAAKAYPAYFGAYDRFPLVREYLDSFGNLYLVGRNGMHRYNNMDHAVLTAMEAVGNIASGDPGKGNIWSVNADEAYLEENGRPDPRRDGSPGRT